jgi:16S rRNA (uracil1498-N3)-methyltransferase
MIRVFGMFEQNNLIVAPDDQFHLMQVLRVKLHETFEVLCEENVYRCNVTQLNPFMFEVMDVLTIDTELPHKITLLYVVPKGDKLDLVIQKAVELGVDEVILLQSKHSVVLWTEDQWKQKQGRFAKQIHDATLQCKRTSLMKLTTLLNFKEAIKLPFTYRFIASEHHLSTEPLSTLLKDASTQNSIAILVGAEGGFTIEEVNMAIEQQFLPLSLGKRILRTETAAIASCVLLSAWSERQ